MLTTEDVKIISDLMDTKFEDFEGKVDTKFDNFAIMIKTALDSKPDREEMDERFNAIDERFDKLEHKVDVLSFRVDQNHDRRLDVIEDNVRQIKSKLKLS